MPSQLGPAQRFEQAGGAVDLIEDDELLGMVGEVQGRLGEAGPVSGRLQVDPRLNRGI